MQINKIFLCQISSGLSLANGLIYTQTRFLNLKIWGKIWAARVSLPIFANLNLILLRPPIL